MDQRRRRQPGLVAQAAALRAAAVPRAARRRGALRRAALPLQLQLPRRRVPPRGAGRGGGPARARGAGPHRPRRLLRRGPLRRGGPGGRAAHGVRRRADASGSTDAAERRSPTPTGAHLLVLARDPEGYARLARAISRGPAGRRREGRARAIDLDRAGRGSARRPLAGAHRLPQGRGAARPSSTDGPAAAARELDGSIDAFGRDNVAVELWDHGDPLDSARNDALAELAVRRRGRRSSPPTTCTTPRPARRPLATALAAVRARRSLDEIDGWLPGGAGAHLRSGAEQARRFARYPGVVERGRRARPRVRLRPAAGRARTCRRSRAPTGHDEMSWLRALTERGRERRYGPRGDRARAAGAYAQIEHELDVIEQLGFPGYFLIVWDIVEFCRRADIFCQGRGSAANSRGLLRARHHQRRRGRARPAVRAVPVARARRPARHRHRHRERPARGGHPVRLRALRPRARRPGRQRHHLPGRSRRCATWPRRSATRTGQQDAWSKQIDRWGPVGRDRGPEPTTTSPPPVLELAAQVEHFPRHLGIHSGGMVHLRPAGHRGVPGRVGADGGPHRAAVGQGRLRRGRPGEVRPARPRACSPRCTTRSTSSPSTTAIERRPGRPSRRTTRSTTCSAGPTRSACSRSRAGPRWPRCPGCKPRTFYDLVVEVALIRPGPIQGGSVHPYIRRRNGTGAGHLPAPAARDGRWRKTLGVPLFQEQLMQMAIDVAGFTPAEADQLRQAMGSKRSRRADGAAAATALRRAWPSGASPATSPTRSSTSSPPSPTSASPRATRCRFAYLVYARRGSSCYYPAAFCAALLNAQPMGFYSPQTLVHDARRHGVEVRTPDVNASRRAERDAASRATTSQRRAAGGAARASARCARSATTSAEAHRRRPARTSSMEDLARRTAR